MELGLIDEIGGLSDALTCLHKMIEQRKSAAAASRRGPIADGAARKRRTRRFVGDKTLQTAEFTSAV